MSKINELMVYKHFEQGKILDDLTWIMDNHNSDYYNQEDIKGLLYDAINDLIELSSGYGLEGNLWHTYLTFLLVNHENGFSIACEKRGNTEGSIRKLALHDFAIIQELFQFDFSIIEKELQVNCFSLLKEYTHTSATSKFFNKRIKERICSLSKSLALAKNVDAFMECLLEFYKDFGVGKLGLHKAFRVDNIAGKTEIIPIHNIAHVQLEDLVGYEIQKKKLIDNTECFIKGKKANNCLLFGDAGTGKSSCIKGILNKYYEDGLRIIEVYKHQFQDLNQVMAQIKNRNYKFIIYMDDLSFEEFEIEYKYLKAVIEGGLEKKPDNILIYATSNRRHLIRENFSDKEGRRDELHASDTVQEKLSLVYRFGVSIFFSSPEKKAFQNIVKVLAKRNKIQMNEERLLLEANKWELSHGGLSGRTAQQFIDYLSGMEGGIN